MIQVNFPSVINTNAADADSFISLYSANEAAIEEILSTVGALKFTGVNISDVGGFQQIVDRISSKFISYIDGNSPRTKLAGNIYTSTEYDKTQKITMHNELSYSAKWPGRLYFTCLVPAETGGETLLADSREILRQMDKTIVEEVRKRGISYIRNLHGGTGVGPSWQDTFETNDRAQLETYCRTYGIDFEWKDDNGLILRQASPGIIKHRKTQQEVWFNQIDQFHPIQLGEEVYESMMLLYDSPEEFPMYVCFGDGKEIEESMIHDMMDTISALTIAPAWEANELLIVDNELIAHGRNPFTGERKVLVTMSE
ncbi:TauD/TfdA family dioxygenase [Chitinophaga varians]|uniref:TauD/TfdA family dioxygenase n=1 Tax=Chitinophaga varians TaxID=2202339 RepID=UPI00165F4F29|nr:TauD/TfdA family dioxygenase [Chitinophaga varians]MBC9914886.1 TauD/TfdA family dioxygenase [Chitinophaga varians]